MWAALFLNSFSLWAPMNLSCGLPCGLAPLHTGQGGLGGIFGKLWGKPRGTLWAALLAGSLEESSRGGRPWGSLWCGPPCGLAFMKKHGEVFGGTLWVGFSGEGNTRAGGGAWADIGGTLCAASWAGPSEQNHMEQLPELRARLPETRSRPDLLFPAPEAWGNYGGIPRRALWASFSDENDRGRGLWGNPAGWSCSSGERSRRQRGALGEPLGNPAPSCCAASAFVPSLPMWFKVDNSRSNPKRYRTNHNFCSPKLNPTTSRCHWPPTGLRLLDNTQNCT